MNLLVIGSKGFIGSHVAHYFSKQYQVWKCDVVVDYTDEHYFQVEATNADYVDVFKKITFDICINCSGAASVPDSINNPQRDFLLNTVNVFKQLDALRQHNKTCKYINLSSAAVYGNPAYLPVDENHQLNPISPYGTHKKLGEEIAALFYDNYKINTCTLRIFSAYGEGLYKQLFYDLYKKANISDSISLHGTGNETRDFIYIEDLLQAIEVVIHKAHFKNDKINVASGQETSIGEAAEIFYFIYKPSVALSFQGEIRKGDPLHWKADISKLCDMGYSPKTSLKEGLTNYITWLRE